LLTIRASARLILLVAALTAGVVKAPAAAQEPGSELRVWLVTIGPGTAIWERFGHNALRVVDTRTGYDASYNWGIFDFNQVDFVPRFLRGEMLYMMAPFASEPMIDMYRSAGREVVVQELDLAPAQKVVLRDFAEQNALPGNREYFYDYFLDNCSTRVRDLLDLSLGGALYAQFGHEDTGTSYRYHTRRLTRPDPLLFTGMDVLLGSPGDQPITRWAEMFIPMTLRDAVREVVVDHGDGVARPLVISEEVVAEARVASEPSDAPTWWPYYLLLGLLLGAGLAWLGRAAAFGAKGSRIAFGVAGGLGGIGRSGRPDPRPGAVHGPPLHGLERESLPAESGFAGVGAPGAHGPGASGVARMGLAGGGGGRTARGGRHRGRAGAVRGAAERHADGALPAHPRRSVVGAQVVRLRAPRWRTSHPTSTPKE
jgi:hypothetical protein